MRLDNLGLDISFIKEFDIIYDGPSDRWWLSARLILGLSQDDALQVHRQLRGAGDYRYSDIVWWNNMRNCARGLL